MMSRTEWILNRDIIIARSAQGNFLVSQVILKQFALFWIHKQSWHLFFLFDYTRKKCLISRAFSLFQGLKQFLALFHFIVKRNIVDQRNDKFFQFPP
jgi:hypothetical protein